MIRHWRYLKYVLRHKWFVFRAGLDTGAPLLRLVIHDWSKFLPSEWIPYAQWFYGWKGGSWHRTHPDHLSVSGKWKKEKYGAAFKRAWLRHIHRNAHHWDHWILKDGEPSGPSDGFVALEMPESLVREMVADWIGAGMAQGHGNDLRPWYAANQNTMLLHPATRALVDELVERHGS